MSSDRHVLREEQRRVRTALREHWDPIGRGAIPELPATEYDGYAPEVVTLLREGADDQRIAEYLRDMERTSMGLTPASLEHLLAVVRAIRSEFEEARRGVT